MNSYLSILGNPNKLYFIGAVITVFIAIASRALPTEIPTAPRHPQTTIYFGETLIDDYRWLREKETAGVQAHLKAESDYTAATLQPHAPLIDRLTQEIRNRFIENDTGVPIRLGNYEYYTRFGLNKPAAIYCRRALKPEADEEVLLDLNQIAHTSPTVFLGAYTISDDGRFLAYSIDQTGQREYLLHVKDLVENREVFDDRISVGTVRWAPDNRTLFFTVRDSTTKRPAQLACWTLGAASQPVIHYTESDPTFNLLLERSRDGHYLFCSSQNPSSTEVRILETSRPQAGLQLLVPRRAGHEYYVDHRDGYFYFITNKDAPNYRLARAPVATPDEAHWEDFLPGDSLTRNEQIELYAGHAVVVQNHNGRRRFLVHDFATGKTSEIPLPPVMCTVSLYGNWDYHTKRFSYQYQSYALPPAILEYDAASHTSQLIKQNRLAGKYDPDDYVTDLIYATAADGTRVPISVFYRKSLRRNGPQPVFLTGYGAYGVTHPVTFSSHKLTLVDRGVIYANAHVRGGGELGETWHQQGRRDKKMNSFTDFISCAEHLCTAGYTQPGQLVIQGKSAGGLLVGAVLNMRPELFRAAILEMPFVDVINTMSDPSLPMTTNDYAEWGNPAVEAEYRWMRAYSPYENIHAQAYPDMLVKVALNDKNVPYWEGAKYVAKLRATKTDPNRLLLHTLFSGSHTGPSDRYAAMKELAIEYAFVLTSLGVEK